MAIIKNTLLALVVATAAGNPSRAAEPASSSREIVVGQTMPYSGPASAYGVIGKTQEAYFNSINEAGGVNGRKIKFLSFDDAYSAPKTVEQTRKLVEQEEVALIFGSLGTPTSLAVRKYLNGKKVPQILLSAGATLFADPKNYPWTMGWSPNYRDEAAAYARRILRSQPGEKIALLYAKDDSGRDFAEGFKAGLGDSISLLVAEATYETADATIDSQIVRLKASGASAFFFHATPKFGAQIIRASYDMGWKPQTYVASTANSIAGAIEPAGFDKAQGLISSSFLKDSSDPQWADDPEMKTFKEWMAKHNPRGDARDSLNVYAYAEAATLLKVLEICRDDLSRASIMAVAKNMNFRVPMLLPGVEIQTTPDDYRPMKKIRLMKFEGTRWHLLPDAS